MSMRLTLGAVLTAVCLWPLGASAQLQMGGGWEKACDDIAKHRKAGNNPAARDAANECAAGLDKLVEGEIAQHIPEQVGDWKRTRLEQSTVVGVSQTTFEYRKGDVRVRGSLMGGGGGRGLGSALQAFNRMGIAAGGGKELMVADVPSQIMPNGQWVISFEDGTSMNFECDKYRTPDAALEGFGDLIDKFPIAKIRDALKGKSR